MRLEDFTRRVDQLIAQADAAIATGFYTRAGQQFVDAGLAAGLNAASLSFLSNVFGLEHPFVKTFEERTKSNYMTSAKAAREILVAAKTEMEGGWSTRVRGLVTAEVFTDFIDMADYLLSEGYKDAAAVMIGSVLEEHLRELCRTAGIVTELERDGERRPKKADLMNSELAANNVYSKLDQKSITAALDLRNKAAHGQYGEYSKEQVSLTYQTVVDFIARTPL
jgi:hypothetical protein